MRAKTAPVTCTSMSERSTDGSLASWILAPRKDCAILKEPVIAVVVIQMSMPKRATSDDHTSWPR
jgi:hypothetical protein